MTWKAVLFNKKLEVKFWNSIIWTTKLTDKISALSNHLNEEYNEKKGKTDNFQNQGEEWLNQSRWVIKPSSGTIAKLAGWTIIKSRWLKPGTIITRTSKIFKVHVGFIRIIDQIGED